MADQDKEVRTETRETLPLKPNTAGLGAPPPPRPAPFARPVREPAAASNAGTIRSPESKKLIVGREIELSGNISTCDRLVVEGRVEADLEDCREIEISGTGTFKGSATIEMAEISGIFEGTLSARDTLIVRSSGRVTGTIRFGKLEIERGGVVIGDIGLIDDNTGG
ncbi:MAG: polymer-forming cytoskeletal protein [Pseudomonadota bacterium]|nr:polymer-forming cytoskeletal protein [Pseudomonadota bacterium]